MDMDMGDQFCNGGGTVMLQGFQVSPPAAVALLMLAVTTAAAAVSWRVHRCCAWISRVLCGVCVLHRLRVLCLCFVLCGW